MSNINIGWIAVGSENTGSTRIGVINIHKGLQSLGYNSFILNLNKTYNPFCDLSEKEIIDKILEKRINIVIFQKVFGQKIKNIINFCKNKKILTILATGDWFDYEEYRLVDKIIVGSPYIRDFIKLKYNLKKVFYIDDAIEITDNIPFKIHTDKVCLNLGWYGNYTKLKYTKKFIESLELSKSFNYNLVTISNTIESTYPMGDGVNIPWDTKKVIDILLKDIDIVIIPIDVSILDKKIIYAKTANRITLPLSLGIPVVSNYLPSYESIIKDGINGYLRDTSKGWLEALNKLSNFEYRKDFVKKDFSNYIRNNFSLKNICNVWANTIMKENNEK